MYYFICQQRPKNSKIIQLTQDQFDKCFDILASKKIFKWAYNHLSLPAQFSEELDATPIFL